MPLGKSTCGLVVVKISTEIQPFNGAEREDILSGRYTTKVSLDNALQRKPKANVYNRAWFENMSQFMPIMTMCPIVENIENEYSLHFLVIIDHIGDQHNADSLDESR